MSEDATIDQLPGSEITATPQGSAIESIGDADTPSNLQSSKRYGKRSSLLTRQSTGGNQTGTAAHDLRVVMLRSPNGDHPELCGPYQQSREAWMGAPVFQNSRRATWMVWDWDGSDSSGRWCIVSQIGNTESMAYMQCPAEFCPPRLPCEAQQPWIVFGSVSDFECTVVRDTVVVSGRSGHNQSINGVYVELPERYESFAAYHDPQKHLYLFRRRNPSSWVIGNRLDGVRGSVFAENHQDVLRPFMTTRPWTITAWGSHVAEEDPNLYVYRAGDDSGGARDGGAPPPPVLTVCSQLHREVEGSYVLVEGEQTNGHSMYVRAAEGDYVEAKFLFWSGDRWCIAESIAARSSECDVRSQRRTASGRNHPDDAVWQGLEVLRGDHVHLAPKLLAALKGRVSFLSKQFLS
eukprot:TRINITY_DN20713_c0_g1_i1.p1 TRINITY_DN20713_c0_g1~~TRINITY_DN20713_c0_g1_i1.p1  ORF type:complete len:406 (+),score=49.17 TRINITY_DN20713_c0_g1_i1:112-1329(+)